MTKYYVPVVRTTQRTKIIEVEADDECDAEEKALMQAPNEVFSGPERNADYTIE